MQNKNNNKRGFTIIETMIAVALFLVVVLVGMDSLLNTTVIHRKSQNMRSIMDNLSFIMEDMSRNLRTGYDYHCDSSGFSSYDIPLSCSNGDTLVAFKTSDGDEQWVYEIIGNKIEKSVAGGSNIILTPPEIDIDATYSKFIVYGAEPPNGDLRQPYIIIRLVGSITDPQSGVETPFALESSVSQRLIDNVIIE